LANIKGKIKEHILQLYYTKTTTTTTTAGNAMVEVSRPNLYGSMCRKIHTETFKNAQT